MATVQFTFKLGPSVSEFTVTVERLGDASFTFDFIDGVMFLCTVKGLANGCCLALYKDGVEVEWTDTPDEIDYVVQSGDQLDTRVKTTRETVEYIDEFKQVVAKACGRQGCKTRFLLFKNDEGSASPSSPKF